MISTDEKLKRAQSAQGDELWSLIHDPHPQIVMNVTLNRNLTEQMALCIAQKRTTPAEALGFLATDVRFKDSQKLKLTLCRNPKTPQRVTFSLLKFLRIFDLGDLTRDQAVPVTIRQKIELLLADKIPSLPSGVKIALAKRANSSIVLSLAERGDAPVINACLDSPVLTEFHICTLINRPSVKPAIVRLIAGHKKWSLRYAVRFGLIRNYHTPMKEVLRFIPEMKTNDLRELYSYESLPASSRPYIFSELRMRGEAIEQPPDEVYELSDEEVPEDGDGPA